MFTVGERNIQIQESIAEKMQQKSEKDAELSKYIAEKGRKEAAKNILLSTFRDNCWNRAKAIREGFDSTQGGYKRRAQFADEVLQINTPTQHDIEAMKLLYETAFDPNARTYKEFQALGGVSRLVGSRGNKLLQNPITSSGDSPFAGFIKALNATDWVRQGHEHFTHTDGKCPYCQQELPDDFERELAACFDAQYQEDIATLRQFHDDYAADMQDFIETLKANLQDVFPKLDLTEYKDKLALFEKVVESNLHRIAEKIKEPSSVVALDNENAKAVREELNALIAEFNLKIHANNAVATAKQQKAKCKTQAWELIAYTLQSEISAYKQSQSNVDGEIATLRQQIIDAGAASHALEIEITDLNKRIISTAPTIKRINDLLRDSGFQGFVLREKRGQQNVYEVVRQDGNVAVKLSEGERNFIAFLCFTISFAEATTTSTSARTKSSLSTTPFRAWIATCCSLSAHWFGI